MLKISKKGYYSVRAIIDIASNSQNNPVSLSNISTRQEISLRFLEQLFMKLRRSKLVKSVRGPGGGYILAKNPKKISIGDILESVEEPIAPSKICMTSKNSSKKGENYCNKIDECVSRLVWQKLDAKMKEILGSISLESLYKEQERLIDKKNRGRKTNLS